MASPEPTYVEQLTIDGPPVHVPVMRERSPERTGSDAVIQEPVPVEGAVVGVQETLDGKSPARQLLRTADGSLRWDN